MMWPLLAADACLVLASILLAVNLRFEGEIPARYQATRMLGTHIAIVLTNLLALWWRGLYGKVWRYAGIHELKDICIAITLSYLPFVAVTFASSGSFYPRSIIIVAWLFTIMLVGATRLMLRLASERTSRDQTDARRMLIVGANDAGEAILRELTRQETKAHLPLGFVDDDKPRGLRIRGVAVLGKVADVAALVSEHRIHEVIVADPRPALIRAVVSVLEAVPDVELKVVPSVASVVEGRTQVSQMREVRIEDLLVRPPVDIDLSTVAGFLQGRRVLVTGAGGSIGSEICRQISGLGVAQIILLGRGENSIYEIAIELQHQGKVPIETVIADVRDAPRMGRIFARTRPHVVFHAAAHKHVPLMELNVEEAITVNVGGTATLVELCARHEVERFILLSTDKAVNPTSVMGWSKKLAELVVLSAARKSVTVPADESSSSATRFVAVRFGNVLGSRGSVVPTFRRQIALGGPVTVTDGKMERFFMTIPEAVTLVIEAAAMARGGEIYILDMGEPVSIMNLARNMIRLSGFEPDTDIPIQVMGTRPGEKLFEELLNVGETESKTEAPKIKRVEGTSFDLDVFARLLAEVVSAADRGDAELLRERLK